VRRAQSASREVVTGPRHDRPRQGSRPRALRRGLFRRGGGALASWRGGQIAAAFAPADGL